jgi:hypothetical protein
VAAAGAAGGATGYGPDPATTLADGAAQLTTSLRGTLAGVRDAIATLFTRSGTTGEAAGAALAGGGGTIAAGGAKLAALCVSVSVAAGGTYCLDTGVLDGTGRPRATIAGADRGIKADDRLRAIERRTDRRQRQVSMSQIITDRARAQARREAAARARERESQASTTVTQTPSQPSPQRPARTATTQTESFTFETAQPTPEPAAPQQSSSSSSGGEFDGGGFEK